MVEMLDHGGALAQVLHRCPTILRVSHKDQNISLAASAASVFPYWQRGLEAGSLKRIAFKKIK